MGDSHDSPNFIKTLVNLFYMVGGVLVAGTLITVVIDVTLPLSFSVAAIVGLSIALVKAAFVVMIFMHYKWDKKLIMITWTMLLTFFFFAGMIGLIMWAEGDIPRWGRAEVPVIWPILASLLGLALPISFTILTIKVLNQPVSVDLEPDSNISKTTDSEPIGVDAPKTIELKTKNDPRHRLDTVEAKSVTSSKSKPEKKSVRVNKVPKDLKSSASPKAKSSASSKAKSSASSKAKSSASSKAKSSASSKAKSSASSKAKTKVRKTKS